MGGRIYRNSDAMWREEDDAKGRAEAGIDRGEDVSDIGTSIVLLNGRIHSLNMLGTAIWKLCDGKEVSGIVAELEDVFDVEHDVLEADVTRFLDEIKALGLIYEK